MEEKNRKNHLEFQETLAKFRIDLHSTRRMLVVFSIVILFLKLVFKVAIPWNVLLIISCWLAPYAFIWPRLISKPKTSNGLYNLYFFFNTIDFLWLTMVAHYIGAADWISPIIYMLILTFAGIIMPKKKTILLALVAFSFYAVLVLSEAFGVVAHRPVFVLYPDLFRSPIFLMTQLLSLAILFVFLVETVGSFSEMLKQKREQLEEERKKVLAAYQKAKEAEKILEVRVRARTRELERLSAHQEEIIRERTKKLEEKIEESERFRRLVVGRELKMIGLKKELEKRKDIKRV